MSPQKFNHAYDFAFEVMSGESSGKDVTPQMLRMALLKRVDGLSDEELMEACGLYDTFTVEEFSV